MKPRSTIVFTLLLASFAAGTGCAHVLRERATPYPDAAPHAAPWRLNRELLLPEETSRILFVVDASAGREPLTGPLDYLARVASHYGERPASWVRAGAPGAPRLAQDATGQLRCPVDSLDPQTSYVFIRYVGDAGWYGRTSRLRLGPECGDREIYVINIAQEKLARHRFPFLTRGRLEAYDLVHEYGHVLGLGSNPAHGYYPYYPDLSSGDHCINPECALAGPHPRAVLYSLFRSGNLFPHNLDYCAECRRDIERAKRHWRTGEEFPEAPRLPKRDLEIWIAKLKAEDFTEGGKAFILLSYGKEVMPALMKRIGALPGKGEDSPHSTADWLAKAIVTREALKRAGKDYNASWVMGDQSRAMLWWWSHEEADFMAGEDWELPPVVTLTRKDGPLPTPAGPDMPGRPIAPEKPATETGPGAR